MSPAGAADDLAELLRRAVSRHLGACEIGELRRLSGGASQETWSFDARLEGQEGRGDRGSLPLVLRRAPAGKRGSTAVAPELEARVQRAAGEAGVPVAGVRFVLAPDDGLGRGYVMDRLEGEAIARRILREPELERARGDLAARCGEILGRLHATPTADLDLPLADGPRQIEQYRALYDRFDEPRPIFDLAFARLAASLPAPERCTLVHGDFRNGNLLVGPDGVRAVLDWELAHCGDPMEDLGWLCVPSWRFGAVERPVGGFGTLDALFAGYRRTSGLAVDAERVRAWMVFGTLKWGVMCMIQGFSHLDGVQRSVEKAAIGRRVSETEADLVRLLAPEIEGEEDLAGGGDGGGRDARGGDAQEEDGDGRPPLRDERPTATDLVAAVRSFLADDLRPALEGRRAFEALVAANALGIVERELELGPRHDALERRGLLELLPGGAGLEVRPTSELARRLSRAVRAGEISHRDPRLLRFLRRSADRKLAIDNPRYRPVGAEVDGIGAD